jgi:hypothetical protein
MDRLRLRRACRRPAAATRTLYFDHGHDLDLDLDLDMDMDLALD